MAALEEESLLACVPCAPESVDQRLLDAFHKRNLPAFRAALRSEPTPDVAVACLHEASGDQDAVDYVRALLDADVNPNVQAKTTHMTALMRAAENNNAKTLEVILKCKRNPPNFDILPPTGDTLLHLVLKKQETPDPERCVRLILRHNHTANFINKKNKKGHTAILWAAKHCVDCPQYIGVVNALLEQDGIDVDSGKFLGSGPMSGSARDILARHHPSLSLPPPVSEKQVDEDALFRMLTYGGEKVDEFCVKVKEGAFNLEYDGGSYTLLQMACSRGCVSAVQALLEKGASVYNTSSNSAYTPVCLAAGSGVSEILRLLIEKCDDKKALFVRCGPSGDTPLIHLVRSWDDIKRRQEDNPNIASWDDLKDEREECLKILLEEVDLDNLDINARNGQRETALHYASVVGDRQLTLKLLKSGAYIGGENAMKRLPITAIPSDVLEQHFDECLESSGQQFDENYKIRFDYSCLVPPVKSFQEHPPSSCKTDDLELGSKGSRAVEIEEAMMHETAPLAYMSANPDLRPLLKHPIITSYLEIKWHRLFWIFGLNLLLFIVYVFFITVHTLWGNGRGRQVDSGNSTESNTEEQPDQEWFSLVQVVATIFWLYLVLREFFQFAVSPKRYFCYSSKENYFELALICTSAYMLFSRDHSASSRFFACSTILLCWGELIQLIGRVPFFATYFEMLKCVSWNFFKFLAWYSTLIVAFALSFFALFRDSDVQDNFFINPISSIFKTAVMMTGEFEVSDIPFVEYPGFSHLVFVLFMFLIAIVLLNLLNGLAVSDTQAIKDDAELVGYVSRVRLIHYFERMILGQSRSCWRRCHWLKRRVTLFPESARYTGRVQPYPKPVLSLVLARDDDEKPSEDTIRCRLSCNIVRVAEEVIARKNRPSDMEQLRNAVRSNELKLTAMENKLKEILEIVRRK